MEEEIDITNNLIDNYDYIPIKNETCLSRLWSFFCLYYSSDKSEKNKYIRKWREYLNKEPEKDISCFRTITNLWAHKNVINDLDKVRLNPNLICTKNIRNDLEFYIPQICTFLIFGEYEKVEELLGFLCKACYGSFFFAHRIIWFLKSLLNTFSKYSDKIFQMIFLIESIYKSEKEKNQIERLHLANSKKYIEFITQKNLSFLFNLDKINQENINLNKKSLLSILDKTASDLLKSYETTENLIKDFIIKHNEFLEDLKQEKKSNINEFEYIHKIKPDEIFVKIFKINFDIIDYKQNLTVLQENNLNISSSSLKQASIESIENYEDINLISFLSTIAFVDSLCNICKNTKNIPMEEQIIYLKRELSDLNKNLPSNVYVPFLNNSFRNYVIVHMPISELKIFRTKTRVLYMTTIELVRIEEIVNKITDLDKKNKVNYIPYKNENTVNNIEELNRGRSYSMATSYNEYLEKKKIIKNNVSKKDRKNSGLNFKNIIEESDINLSKPITIETLVNERKRRKIFLKKDPLAKQTKILLEEKWENDVFIQGEDVENLIKYRITQTSSKLSKRLNFGFIDQNQKMKFSKSIIEKKNEENNLDEIKFSGKSKNNNNNFTGEVNKKYSMPTKKTEENKTNNLLNNYDIIIEDDSENTKNFNDTNFTIKNNIVDVRPSEEDGIFRNIYDKEIIKEEKDKISSNKLSVGSNSSNIKSNQDLSLECAVKNIFGELLENQAERIKNFSPFGNLKTWKILKSGEDLIQEQFATQLINEFYQIFQIEKVDCWVNTYEIIATGNQSGLIEYVSNTISIDELKKKLKNMSLRDFFLSYFGPVTSNNFKNAMMNFIQSLAGYSLLCYFLQIKDRHNQNILLDNTGHIIHIDFGFLLSNSPGKGLKFEKAPFKLTNDIVECMGGINSKYFSKFRKLLWKGFTALVKHSQKIIILVEMMYLGFGDTLSCFIDKESTIGELKNRFYPRPNMKTHDYCRHVDFLIEQSIDNWRTNWYDKIQYVLQGILY